LSRIIHMRGDVAGMLVLFIVAFLGAWQVAVAVFRLNGLSLTGYPDRPCWSKVIGAVLVAGSCAWYFSTPGHFASPDVEGIETLILLVGGLVIATAAQVALASAAGLVWRRRAVTVPEVARGEEVTFDVGGVPVSASYLEGAGVGAERGGAPVLLMHDYGGSMDDVSLLAHGLAEGGHSSLAFDLTGHGDNRLEIDSAAMEELLDAAAASLAELTGGEALAAVGVGLGGTLAMDLVRRGIAVKAVALDPPARDDDGYGRVDAMRELGPLDVISAFVRPAARGAGGKRVSLARLIRDMPPAGTLPDDGVTVIGTVGHWLNAPAALASYSARCGLSRPLQVEGTHTAIAASDAAIKAVLGSINGVRS
jgi:pimeloyl-ACP methyl ester carboxylesterase